MIEFKDNFPGFQNPEDYFADVRKAREEAGATEVYGTGGKLRHVGQFSPNNPYLSQLNLATNNADKDALYAQALEWEADNATLLEQRDYEDPFNQLARQRRAGINADIAGGSSGGSGGVSSGSAAQQADTQSGAKYSNVYDNATMVMEGFNTAANIVTSITGFANVLGNMYTAFGPGAELQRANANLANVQANELPKQVQAQQTTSEAQKTSAEAQKTMAATTEATQSVSREGLMLSNLKMGVENIYELASIITQNMDDKTASSILSVAGVPKSERPAIIQAVRNLHQNPALSSKFYGDSYHSSMNSAMNKVFAGKSAVNYVQAGYDVKMAENAFKVLDYNVQTSLTEALVATGYYDHLAEGMTEEAKTAIEQNKLNQETIAFARQQLEQDVKAFVNGLSAIKDQANGIKEEIDEILAIAEKRGRQPTIHEQAALDDLTNRYNYLMMMGTQQMGNLFSFAQNTASSVYLHKNYITRSGNLTKVVGTANEFTFNNFHFQNFMKGDYSDAQLVQGYLNILANFSGGLIEAAMKTKGVKP